MSILKTANQPSVRAHTQLPSSAPADASQHTPRPSWLWYDYSLGILSVVSAIALTFCFRTDPGVSLFFCLVAVAVTSHACSRIPRLFTTLSTILFMACYLPSRNGIAAAGSYQALLALYVVACCFISIAGARRQNRQGNRNQAPVLSPPTGSPAEILDNQVKGQALARGNATVPRTSLYLCVREVAHLSDLIWNIDDSWRRQDWKMMAVIIKLAYTQVAQTEKIILQMGAEALQDPVEAASSSATRNPLEVMPGAVETLSVGS